MEISFSPHTKTAGLIGMNSLAVAVTSWPTLDTVLKLGQVLVVFASLVLTCYHIYKTRLQVRHLKDKEAHRHNP